MDWTHELLRVALGVIFQAAVLHKKNAWCLAEEQWSHPWTSKKYQLPGSFSCRAPFSPHKRTSRQERTGTTAELAAAAGCRERPHMWGDSRLWEVRTGVKARTSSNHSFPSLLLLSSRKLANPALPVPSLALPCGFAYAAEQTGASFAFVSSFENMIHCPRINFETTQLLE